MLKSPKKTTRLESKVYHAIALVQELRSITSGLQAHFYITFAANGTSVLHFTIEFAPCT